MYGWSKYILLLVCCGIAYLLATCGGCSKAEQTVPLQIITQEEVFDFNVWVADTPKKAEKGLMYRESLGDFEGMIFYEETPKEWSMWMKNTKIPLDMLFFDENGIIFHIVDKATPYSEKLIFSTGPAKGVLELKGGTARRLNIRQGDKIKSFLLEKKEKTR